ncbi:GyrI-like domain-containing protein [Methanobrevibacter sp. DSM 116169]|uniref:GyrI-like domain-containing protein n=1 Tax=Methanobrevibacter sp. DSM 116169 TaxID=3242727 RepID=UPI0038FCAF8A
MNYKGNVENMGDLMEKLMNYIIENNVNVIGAPFSLYYTDPSMVKPEDMVYDMGFPIAGEAKEEGEVKIKEIPKHNVISGIHKGEYTKLGETYMSIWNYITENKFEPNGIPKEIYLNSPTEVSPDELLTEVQFPIE